MPTEPQQVDTALAPNDQQVATALGGPPNTDLGQAGGDQDPPGDAKASAPSPAPDETPSVTDDKSPPGSTSANPGNEAKPPGTDLSEQESTGQQGILKDSTPGPIVEPKPFQFKMHKQPTGVWSKCYTKSLDSLIALTPAELAKPLTIPEFARIMAWVKTNPKNTKKHSEYLSKDCEGRLEFTLGEWQDLVHGAFCKGPQGIYIFQQLKQAKRAVKNLILRLLVTSPALFPSWDSATNCFTDPTQLELALLVGNSMFGDIFHSQMQASATTLGLAVIKPTPPMTMLYSKVTEQAVKAAQLAELVASGDGPKRTFCGIRLPSHAEFPYTDFWKGNPYKRWGLRLVLKYLHVADPTAKLLPYPLANIAPTTKAISHLTAPHNLPKDGKGLGIYLNGVWIRPNGIEARGNLYLEHTQPLEAIIACFEKLSQEDPLESKEDGYGNVTEGTLPLHFPLKTMSHELVLSKNGIQEPVLSEVGWLHGTSRHTDLPLLYTALRETHAFRQLPHVDFKLEHKEIRFEEGEKRPPAEKAYAVHVLCGKANYTTVLQACSVIYDPARKTGFPLHCKFTFVISFLSDQCTLNRSDEQIQSNAMAYRAHQWEMNNNLKFFLLENTIADPTVVPPLAGCNLFEFMHSILEPAPSPDQPPRKVFAGLDRHPTNSATFVLSYLAQNGSSAKVLKQRLGILVSSRLGEPGWDYFLPSYKTDQQTSFQYDQEDRRYISMGDRYMQGLGNSQVVQANYIIPSNYVPPPCMIQSIIVALPRGHRAHSNYPAVQAGPNGQPVELASQASTRKTGVLGDAEAVSTVAGMDTLDSSTGMDTGADSEVESLDSHEEIQVLMTKKLERLANKPPPVRNDDSLSASSDDDMSDASLLEDSTTGPRSMEVMVLATPPRQHRVAWTEDQEIPAAPPTGAKVEPSDYTHSMTACEDWIKELDSVHTREKATPADQEAFKAKYDNWATEQHPPLSPHYMHLDQLWNIFLWYYHAATATADTPHYYFYRPMEPLDQFFGHYVGTSDIYEIVHDYCSERIIYATPVYPEHEAKYSNPGHPHHGAQLAIMRIPPPPYSKTHQATKDRLAKKHSWLWTDFQRQILNPELVYSLFCWAQMTCKLWDRFETWESFLAKGTASTIREMQDTLIYAHKTIRQCQDPFDTDFHSSSRVIVRYRTVIKEEPPDEQGGLDE